MKETEMINCWPQNSTKNNINIIRTAIGTFIIATLHQNRTIVMMGREWFMMTQYLTLAIYDVADDKRRNKLVKVMEYYGLRVQESAFEAMLTINQCSRMIDRALDCLDLEEDSFRVYVIRNEKDVKTYGIGDIERDDCYVI